MPPGPRATPHPWNAVAPTYAAEVVPRFEAIELLAARGLANVTGVVGDGQALPCPDGTFAPAELTLTALLTVGVAS